MIITWQIVFVLALAGIIIYFLLRLRVMMKNMPGATEKMNSIQLVKNWQEQKALEAQHQADLRAQAKQMVRPEAEKIMMQKYMREELASMTADKSLQARDKMREGLGIDLDKAASKENLSYMIGKKVDNNSTNNMFGKDNLKNMGMDQHTDIFSKERIKGMSQGNVSNAKLKDAASNNVNWDGGVKKALRNENTMSGLDRALYRKK